MLGIIVSGLGLLLGLGGLLIAIVRRGSGIGFSIAGSCLSAVSLSLCLIWTQAIFGDAFKKVADAAERARLQNQKASGSAWVDASNGAVRLGDVQVYITEVTIGPVPLKVFLGTTTSKDEWLAVKVELVNKNSTKKIEYHSWSGKDFAIKRDFATLKDNFDNNYKRINFDVGAHPVGAVESSESIYPNKTVTDVLVFEVPLDTMQYLLLELPGENFGGTGMLRLKIPKAMIKR